MNALDSNVTDVCVDDVILEMFKMRKILIVHGGRGRCIVPSHLDDVVTWKFSKFEVF